MAEPETGPSSNIAESAPSFRPSRSSMSRTNIIVIGGGLLGVATAYELASRGESVDLIEAREGVALETSYANGAMLTAAMSDPWNAPGVHRHLLASLFDPHSAIKLRLTALPSLLRWGLQFIRNSSAEQHRRATEANYLLAAYSIRATQELRERLGLQYQAFASGSMKVFRDRAAMAGPIALAQTLQRLGLRYEILDSSGAIGVEPELSPIRSHIGGALYFPDDEGGDAHLFCGELARRFTSAGGRLRTNLTVQRVMLKGKTLVGVQTDDGLLEAGRVVVAAGNGSAKLLRNVGISVPIQPAKGYSVTLSMPDDHPIPRVAVIDDAMHAAVVPLGARLRVVGTAEFAGMNRVVRADRIENLLRMFAGLYPAIAVRIDYGTAQEWTGLRPMSADGLPFVGATRVPGIYLNTGHGHLGWTLAAGSARLLADLMLGVAPSIDPQPFSAIR